MACTISFSQLLIFRPAVGC